MAVKIHHATTKRAKKFGIELSTLDNDVVASKDGKTLASGPQANKVLEQAISKLGLTETAKAPKAKKAPARKKAAKRRKRRASEDGDEDDDEADEGGSVVKSQYKKKYRPFKMTCGDNIAKQVSDHVKVEGEDGKLRIDVPKLVAFARANDCWDPKYRALNVGMQRMNVVNRLRGKMRRDKHKIVWA